MDLIERYLASVRVLLPRSQRDDIIAELRDVLTGRREEAAARLGHPLSQDEEESLLREFGHPTLVAGRYRPQQYLIGPELYPVYSFVLKLALAIVAGAALVVGIAGTVVFSGAHTRPLGIAMTIAWNGTFGAIGMITLIFAILQRYSGQLGLFDNWPAREPPALKRASRRFTSFVNHVAGIVADALFILLWIRLVPLAMTPPAGEGQGLHVGLAPVWQLLYVPVVATALYAIVVHVVRLTARGRGRRGYQFDLALQIVLLSVFTAALLGGHWFLVTGVGVPVQVVANVDRGLNLTMQLSVLVVIAVAVIRGGYDLWQLFRRDQSVSAAST